MSDNWRAIGTKRAEAMIEQFGSLDAAWRRMRRDQPPAPARAVDAFPGRREVDALQEERRLARQLGEVWD